MKKIKKVHIRMLWVLLAVFALLMLAAAYLLDLAYALISAPVFIAYIVLAVKLSRCPNCGRPMPFHVLMNSGKRPERCLNCGKYVESE